MSLKKFEKSLCVVLQKISILSCVNFVVFALRLSLFAARRPVLEKNLFRAFAGWLSKILCVLLPGGKTYSSILRVSLSVKYGIIFLLQLLRACVCVKFCLFYHCIPLITRSLFIHNGKTKYLKHILRKRSQNKLYRFLPKTQ